MPVVSLGKVIYHKTPNLMEKLRHADYIIRPDDAHYDLEEINEFCDEHELWPKVIYYDKKDSPQLDVHRLRACGAYIKRSWPNWFDRSPRKRPEFPVLPMDYGLINEYFHTPIPAVKDIDVVCPFLPDQKIGKRRFAIVSALVKARHRFKISVIGQNPIRGRIGRRAIFDPPENNPFLEYLSLIKHAKIIFTAYPEPQNGDSRTWEAFSSGALVFKEQSYIPSPYPFQHCKHCIIYDSLSEASIQEAIDLAVYYLKHDSERRRIAREGYDYARQYHMPRNRIDYILSWVNSADKKLEKHVVGPVEFA